MNPDSRFTYTDQRNENGVSNLSVLLRQLLRFFNLAGKGNEDSTFSYSIALHYSTTTGHMSSLKESNRVRYIMAQLSVLNSQSQCLKLSQWIFESLYLTILILPQYSWTIWRLLKTVTEKLMLKKSGTKRRLNIHCLWSSTDFRLAALVTRPMTNAVKMTLAKMTAIHKVFQATKHNQKNSIETDQGQVYFSRTSYFSRI